MVMTFDQLVLVDRTVALDAVLAIDGIPILFGLRSSRPRVWSGSAVANIPVGWASTPAIVTDSITLHGSKLEMFSGIATGGGASVKLARAPSINRYLEKLRGPRTELTADLNAVGTVLTVADTTGFANGQYVYVHRETIRVGTVASATSMTGCTRNAIAIQDSVAEQHYSSASGFRTIVASGPNYLAGRPAILRVYPGEDDTVFHDVPLRLKDVSDKPGTGVWELSFDDLSALLDRKVAVGFTGAKIKSVEVTAPTKIYPDVMDDWGSANDAGQVWIRPEEGSLLPPALINVGTIGADNFTVNPYALLSFFQVAEAIKAAQTGNDVDVYNNASIRRVYAFRDYPMVMALKVLLSVVGDGTNHATWDTLYGRALDSSLPYAAGETERRMGAGIPAALIDVAALEAFAGESRPGWFYVHGGRGEEDLTEILENVADALGIVFYWNSAGLFSAKRLGAAYANDGSRTLTDVDMVVAEPGTSSIDESNVAHTVTIHSNVWPDDTAPKVHSQAQQNELRQLYRNTQAIPLEVTRRGLWLNAPGQPTVPWRGILPNGMDHRQLQSALHRFFLRRSILLRSYRVTTGGIKFLATKVGDRIALTGRVLNAFDGSSPSGLAVDVYAVTPKLGETVELLLRETINGKLLGPVGRVSSVVGQVVTLTTSSTLWGGGTSPAYYFGDDWPVRVLSGAASPIWSTARGTGTVVPTSDTQLDFGGTIPAGVAAGDIIIPDVYDTAASGGTNQNQTAVPHDYLYLADAGFRLGAANDAAHQWG